MEEKGLVVIVDDEVQIGKLLAEYLLRMDIVALAFSSANEALKYAEEAPVSLLITDIDMPGMNGFQLLEMIKQIKPCIKVILMTGYPDKQREIRAKNEGAVTVLSKPLATKEFLRVIEACLQDLQE